MAKGRDEICFNWLQNKCYEFKWDAEAKFWYCGMKKGVRRPHPMIRHDWDPEQGTAFRFTITASKRVTKHLNDYGLEPEELANPARQMRTWKIKAIADESLTTVRQIFDFACNRMVSLSV